MSVSSRRSAGVPRPRAETLDGHRRSRWLMSPGMSFARVAGPVIAVLIAAAPAAGQTGVVPDAGIRVRVGPPNDICREIRLAANAGLPWVNMSADWESLEPVQGEYRDPATERQMLTCAKDLGLGTQLIVTNAPAWASGRTASNDPPLPANVPAYAAFLKDLATGLAPVVDVWTVWNEPNFELQWASPRDPVRYVELQKAGYAAIKPVDPMSRVSAAAVVGTPTGSGTNAWEYLQAMFDAGIKGSADLYLWNFYPRTAPEGTAVDYKGRPAPWALSSGTYARQIIEANDPGKPLWITETSYATCKSPCSGAANQVTEAVQADYLARMYTYRRRYLEAAVDRIFWFETHDPTADLNDWFSNQGIYRFDWSAKPAVAAFESIRVAGAAPPGSGSGGSTGGSVPPPALPGPAATPPVPASGVTPSGTRITLSKLRVASRGGRLTVRFTAKVSSGRARVRVEGFRARRWRVVKVLVLRRSSGVALRFPDRGYLGVRVLAKPVGARRWLASRVARIPVGR